ncbi:MAG: penicillin-binding protein activator [Burkholderiales bacterium]|jgi:hypothetical protein|nr:penicillin-binding protein activator [Burkholderiales bacterium]
MWTVRHHQGFFKKRVVTSALALWLAIVTSLFGIPTALSQDAKDLDALKETPAEINIYWEDIDNPARQDASSSVEPNAPLHNAPQVTTTPPASGAPVTATQPAEDINNTHQTLTPFLPLTAVANEPPKIALLVPTKTPAYSVAAQTVLAGFTKAAASANAMPSCVVIEHGIGEFFNAYNDAIRQGARVVVGPLVRDDLTELAKTTPPLWTIALTQMEDFHAAMPSSVLFLTLAIESDAKLLAREIALSSRSGIPVILTNESPLMKRFTDAFIDEWTALGKDMRPERIVFENSKLSLLKTRLGELSPSVVVLAVDGDDAALARAQTRAWPTYASSHIYRRAVQFEGYALDALRVAEIPWLIQPSAETFRALGTQPQLPALARLYALGFDAFQVAQQFLGGTPDSFSFWGASGNISFNLENGLSRYGQLGVFEEGRLRALNAQR